MPKCFRTTGLPVLIAACVLLAAPRGEAQEWIVDLSAGHSAHGPVQGAVAATGLTLGVRHEGTPWFFLSASAPFDAAGLPWGAVGLGGRLATPGRSVTLGLDAGAHGFAWFDRVALRSGGGVVAEAMPLVALRAGRLGLEARSGVIHYGSLYAGEAASRTVYQTDAQAVLSAGWLRLAGESRLLRAAEADYPYLGGSVQVNIERVTLIARGGSWLSEAIETPVWGVAGRVRLNTATEAHLAFQQETSDPLYWNAPRRSWSAGFSRRIGRSVLPAVPARVATRVEGGITFRLPLKAAASAPHLAGDFSDWKSVPMVRAGDHWSVTLPLAAGVYRYAFRAANGEWFVPEDHPGREPDGFGGYNAVLIVP
jgi:hypothetical protein